MTPPVTFTKVSLPNGWLGNMAPYPITNHGRVWPTAEHVFQAMRFTNRAIQEEIRAHKSPMAAKFCAKSHTNEMTTAPMSPDDIRHMWAVLVLKVAQHPELRERLLATGDARIIEDVTNRRRAGNHRFWGAALNEHGQWDGANMLGYLWERIRDQIRATPGFPLNTDPPTNL